MIGGFKMNVHVKKSVRPTLYYMSKMISVTWLVFKLLSAQRNTAEFLLSHITHYYFIVQQGNNVFLNAYYGLWNVKTIYL